MIYLDNGATSFPKPPQVQRAVMDAMASCTSPGRGGYPAAAKAERVLYRCREEASKLFDCLPEQAVLTTNCTHGLNIAVKSLVKPGGRVVISGFEHNAVTRPLHGLHARITVAGRKLFDWEDTLSRFEDALKAGAETAIFTHVSNVFGYILPVEELAKLCKNYSVPFAVDGAQSAGVLPLSLEKLGANFIAMPGHKGLLGPQGTGLLLCADSAKPLQEGGTGSASLLQEMPSFLPDRLEAGTHNVLGIAGLAEGIRLVRKMGVDAIFRREHTRLREIIKGLKALGYPVFSGAHQAATVSFLPGIDCQQAAARLAGQGIAVRAGLHCAPLAHESAGTLDTGTVRVSPGYRTNSRETQDFLRAATKLR